MTEFNIKIMKVFEKEENLKVGLKHIKGAFLQLKDISFVKM